LLTCSRHLQQLSSLPAAHDQFCSGSGLTTNRENQLTPRDSVLPLTVFLFFSTSGLL